MFILLLYSVFEAQQKSIQQCKQINRGVNLHINIQRPITVSQVSYINISPQINKNTSLNECQDNMPQPHAMLALLSLLNTQSPTNHSILHRSFKQHWTAFLIIAHAICTICHKLKCLY